ncbi:MAG: M20/M25/M40 family metallo-hydrolase, partial [Acidobacteriaceae bacterium]|nr:M20/M25/M40 family metallo-hydrolase [Acidobacteriaceae bacterium]
VRRNATAIQRLLAARGLKARLLETPGAPPVVFGEIPAPGAQRTVVFYAHYDGQPLNPKEWATPPWQPMLRQGLLDNNAPVVPLPPAPGKIGPEWRLYARSASDDKAPIVALVTALDALGNGGIALHQNVKFVFEGEEEAGSPHLGKILETNRDLLRADVWLICDGPVHQTRRQLIVFGARGVFDVEITLYGPRHELHSGHYGNWVPNPAMMLARLLASMKDDEGHVLIEHYYDGIEPLSETERRALAASPDIDGQLRDEFWIGRSESNGRRLEDVLNYPSLNVRGMASARVGSQASNVIPSSATATLDVRLVKGIDGKVEAGRILDHIRKQGYFVVDHEPDQAERMAHAKVAKVLVHPGYNASRTSMDLPIAQLVIRTAAEARGPLVLLPTSGGSVPLITINDILASPTILVPIANHDNNQHAANENLRIQNLWDGIELMSALLAMN